MAKPHPLIVALNVRIFEHGLTPGVVLKEARMSPANWSRWAHGMRPNAASVDEMNWAIDRLIARDGVK